MPAVSRYRPELHRMVSIRAGKTLQRTRPTWYLGLFVSPMLIKCTTHFFIMLVVNSKGKESVKLK
jgi:hypothetical protein